MSFAESGVLYARMNMTGFAGDKDVILIPDDLRLSDELVGDIMRDLDLPTPNLILDGVGSSVHPSYLLTDGEVDLIAATRLLGMGSDRHEIRDVMVNKMSNVSGAILKALKETASSFFAFSTWMTTFDILCAISLSADGSTFVGGTAEGISTFHVNDETISDKQSKEIIDSLFEHAVPLNEYAKDDWNVELLFDGTYLKDAMFNPWEDHSCLTEDRKNLKPEEDRWPTSQWCNPLAQTLFLFFCRKAGTLKDLDKTKTVGIGWDPMKRRELVAPPGMVFIGGHSQSVKDSYKQCFEESLPTLIIKYSGGISNVYAQLVDSLKKLIDGDQSELYEVAESTMQRFVRIDKLSISQRLGVVCPQTLLKKAYDNSAQDPQAEIRVTIADVVTLLDMAKENPQVFQHTIQVLDPLKQSPEDALDIISASFFCQGSVSLDARSVDILSEAWKMRQAFAKRSSHHMNRLISYECTAAILTWFALVCASLKIASEHCHVKDPSPLLWTFCTGVLGLLPHAVAALVPKILNSLTVIVPITAGFLQAFKSLFHFQQSWARATMAGEEIESHIFQFRAGTGPYLKPNKAVSSRADADGEPEKFPSELSLSKRTPSGKRLLATQRAHSTLRHCLSVNLQKIYVKATEKEELSDQFTTLKAEFGEIVSSQPRASRNASEMKQTPLLRTSTSHDNGVSRLNGDQYYSIRHQQLESGYLHQAPNLARAQNFMNVWILFGGLVASLLGAYHMAIWIPVVVGFTGMLQHLLAIHRGSEELAAVNRALGGLQSVSLRWKSLSRTDRHAPRIKEQMVTLTEQQHMEVIMAKTGISEFLSRGIEDEVEGEKEEVRVASVKRLRSHVRGPCT